MNYYIVIILNNSKSDNNQHSQKTLTNETKNKVINQLGQLRANKFVQHVGKVREVNTFPDGVAYTPK
ncbi:hypothetical protein ABM134_08125 [Enterococcus cecorum]